MHEIYEHAIKLCAMLPDYAEAYIVGGAARDYVMGINPSDVDIEVFHVQPLDLVDWAKSVDSRADVFGKSFGVITVKFRGHKFDVSIPRWESKTGDGHTNFAIRSDPEMSTYEAARRRDFTMNALMLEIPSLKVIDHFQGVRDIETGMLVPTSPAFKEDALRVLRGMQFAARLGMGGVSSELIRYAEELVPSFKYLSKDRIWGEWYKWAKSRYPSEGLRLLRLTGWDAFFPGLVPMQGTKQEKVYHPEGDVWEHTTLVCDSMAHTMEWDDIQDQDTKATLMFAALCHDMGKASMTQTDEWGFIKSYGHERESAVCARRFMVAIGAPVEITERVVRLVEMHMRKYIEPTKKSISRLARDLSPYATVREWCTLVYADAAGVGFGAQRSAPNVGRILEVAETIQLSDQAPAPLIMGRDLIALGLRPGPAFGDILRAAMEAQLEGEFDEETKDIWIRSYLIHEKGMKL